MIKSPFSVVEVAQRIHDLTTDHIICSWVDILMMHASLLPVQPATTLFCCSSGGHRLKHEMNLNAYCSSTRPVKIYSTLMRGDPYMPTYICHSITRLLLRMRSEDTIICFALENLLGKNYYLMPRTQLTHRPIILVQSDKGMICAHDYKLRWSTIALLVTL